MTASREKPTRILVFFATNNVGGPGKGLFQLVENIDPTSVEFTICNFKHPDQETFEFLEAAREAGIDIRLITQKWAFDPSMVKQALRIARDGAYDVVQSHGYKTHILAWVVAKRLALPWVALSHGWTSENLKIRLYNSIERLMLKLSDSVIGVAPDLYLEAVRLRNGRRSRTILNAIEDRDRSDGNPRGVLRQELGVAKSEFLIGVFGRLSHEKGQDLLIEALRKLKHKDATKVVLLGEGIALERLMSQTKKFEIEEHVLFLGYQKDIVGFYKAIDLCVLPSRSEGLPNVVLEAQLSQCPVIAFNVGGVSETIRDQKTGYLVDSGDIDALAKKIDWAFDNREDISAAGIAARDDLFPKFSVGRRCDEFSDEYDWLSRRAGHE